MDPGSSLGRQKYPVTPGDVVVAIVKKRLALEGSMHAILQVLSLSLFEVKPLAELLGEQLLNDETGEPEAQFCLFPEISGQ